MKVVTSIATLFVCTACPSAGNVTPTAAVPVGAGEKLLAAVEQAITEDLRGVVAICGVKCMGGCQTPCSVAFAGAGRETLLFGGLGVGDVEDIVACMRAYVERPPGYRMTRRERPESMQDNLNVRVPAV